MGPLIGRRGGIGAPNAVVAGEEPDDKRPPARLPAVARFG
jgi:hypothetical protein